VIAKPAVIGGETNVLLSRTRARRWRRRPKQRAASEARAAAGQAGVERALALLRAEVERDMKLMGCTAISQLSRDNLRFR